MEYFTSTFQGYQPIFVGAGCLALGYMYGRHCRSVIETNVDVPMASDAACCAQTECNNYVLDHAAVEPERMAVIRRSESCPSDSALNYSDREVVEKPERCGKRNSGQLEIFQMPRKKEDTLWAQSGAFKKQKGVPVITIQKKEPIPSKVESEQDSDDEILAQRLEYFINQSASISKSGGSNVLKLRKKKKKKKSSADMTTSCEVKKGKDITMDSQRSLSKTTTKSRSGLLELATPYHDQGECSLEDTCRSPKRVCLEDYSGEKEGRACQVEETNSAPQMDTVTVPMPCAKSSAFFSVKYSLSNPLEGYLGDDSMGPDSVVLMDSQCELFNEPDNNDSDHTMGENEEDERPTGDARMQDCISNSEEGVTVLVESPGEKQLDLPTSPPPEFHEQDRCLGEVEREVKREHEVPMDKVLKVEIYELLHAADCAKVSFEEIVSLLEEKLKVVLQEDKAHIVSLVREVINISKLLEEETDLEGLEQVEAACNHVCC